MEKLRILAKAIKTNKTFKFIVNEKCSNEKMMLHQLLQKLESGEHVCVKSHYKHCQDPKEGSTLNIIYEVK